MARTKTADAQGAIWVMSNRVDDRVVLFEKDAAHPGGEAFVGGNKVDQVARTGTVEGLLRAGLLVEIPEPPDGPKKPVALDGGDGVQLPNQPGQPIQLGRVPDPDLVPAGAAAKVQAQQAELPEQIKSAAELPPPIPSA